MSFARYGVPGEDYCVWVGSKADVDAFLIEQIRKNDTDFEYNPDTNSYRDHETDAVIHFYPDLESALKKERKLYREGDNKSFFEYTVAPPPTVKSEGYLNGKRYSTTVPAGTTRDTIREEVNNQLKDGGVDPDTKVSLHTPWIQSWTFNPQPDTKISYIARYLPSGKSAMWFCFEARRGATTSELIEAAGKVKQPQPLDGEVWDDAAAVDGNGKTFPLPVTGRTDLAYTLYYSNYANPVKATFTAPAGMSLADLMRRGEAAFKKERPMTKGTTYALYKGTERVALYVYGGE